jgi:hypothetical protein
MTLLKPGRKATYKLPDGSTYELTVNRDELSGRTLDAEVARRVFGYEVEWRTNARTSETDYVQRTPSGGDWVRVAFYSSSGAAINVQAELERRGWKRIVLPTVQWHSPNNAHVVFEHSDGRVVAASGPVNTALCLAAIKAVT